MCVCWLFQFFLSFPSPYQSGVYTIFYTFFRFFFVIHFLFCYRLLLSLPPLPLPFLFPIHHICESAFLSLPSSATRAIVGRPFHTALSLFPPFSLPPIRGLS